MSPYGAIQFLLFKTAGLTGSAFYIRRHLTGSNHITVRQ